MIQISSSTRFHFMGIGGAGVSALAQLLREQNYAVSGCDLAPSKVTTRLEKLGAHVFYEHQPKHVEDCDVVVYSSAISSKDPELQRALSLGKTVVHRSHMLSFLSEGKKGIAITGCHGKTTTTAMVASLLVQAGLDPTAMVGAEVAELGGNARWGKGPHFVYEADESDGSFVHFSPHYFVVTNLDNDHLDYYESFPKLLQLFKNYLAQRREKQQIFVSHEDPVLREWSRDFSLNSCVTFGFGEEPHVAAREWKSEGWKSEFTLYYRNQKIGRVTLGLPGRHNVMNAVAACAVALELGIPFVVIEKTLREFRGAERRFQIKGKEQGVWVVDDYAHHPTEITATLAAARTLLPRKLICVFQPHRYTRTRDLSEAFPAALSAADEVLLTDVYAASEVPIVGVDGEWLYQKSRQAGYTHFRYVKDFSQIASLIAPELKGGEMVMTIGAGDIYKVGEALVEKLKNG